MKILIRRLALTSFVAFRSFLSFIRSHSSRIASNILAMAKYPYLRCDLSSELLIEGKLTIYGKVIIGRRTRIVVPYGCELVLHGDNIILDDVLIAPDPLISIGRGTSIQDGCILLGSICVEQYCLFAPRVFASSGRHSFRGSSKYPAWFLIKLQDYIMPIHANPIAIGADTWIGINSVFLPGSSIGKGTIVGANSLIRGVFDQNYAIVAGTPATYIGSRWIDSGRQLSAGDELSSDE